MPDLIDHARVLVDKGMAVLPVLDKRPYIRDWVNVDSEELLENENNWKKSNGIGLILGPRSGLICLDIDILSGNDNLANVREELESILPPIYCGLVGNPDKPPARLFRFNEEACEKFKYIDCEILSEGNQKLIPPSFNPVSKTNYEWVGKSLYDLDADDFPDLPNLVLEFLRAKNEEYRSYSRGGEVSKVLTQAPGRSCHGSHNYISSLGLSLLYQGFSFEDIVDRVLETDKKINKKSDFTYFNCPSRIEYKGKPERINAQRFTGELFFRNVGKRHDASDYFKEELVNGFTYRDPENAKAKPIRQHISLYNFLKIRSDVWYCPEIRSFQVYDGKKYDVKSEDFIRKFAQDHFKNPACTSIGDKNTFLDYAKNAQQCSAYEFMLKDQGLINLQNGVFSLESQSLRKHNKKYKFPYIIDVPYVNDDEAPTWDALLSLITLSRPHMQKAIEEFIGYAISGCSYDRFNKLLILDGGGSNGKSTLIRVIQNLLGDENTSSVSLHSISTERFAGFNLVNKLINFCAEEPKEAFANTGAIKKITGGDSIMVEEKHKGAFQYHNLAKLIISYNKMPFFPDDSSGMKRRIMLIPCQQNFDANPSLKIKNPQQTIFDNERPQILSRCINAFSQVLIRGYFTDVDEGAERVDEMIVDSNPVLGFIEDEIILDDESYLTLDDLFERFKQSQGGITRITKRKFIKRLADELAKEGIEKSVKRISSGTFKVFSGIKFA